MKTTRPKLELDIDAITKIVNDKVKHLTEKERIDYMDEILTCRPGGVIRCHDRRLTTIKSNDDTIS